LEQPETPPEKLPLEEQTHPNLQSGLFLCKSFSPKPFWIVFGNVKKPTFLKTKIYKENMLNDIYRDKQGYAYLLIPLMPINNKEVEFFQELYSHAWDLGLREDAYVIAPLIYGLDLTNFDEVVNNYCQTYTKEELADTFKKVYNHISSTYPFTSGDFRGFYYSDRDKKFKGWNMEDNTLRSKLSVLTCLLRAIIKTGSTEDAAKIMNETTKQYFSKVEF